MSFVEKSKTEKFKRIGELDALRGLAALSVILFHYTTKYSQIFNSEFTISEFNFKYGHYGVQLFFMISGFVIFMTLDKIKNGKDFIFKRFIRLYPIYWICMIFTFIVTYVFQPGFGRTFRDFIFSFTMIPGLLGAKAVDGAYWSLVPELFFYLLMFLALITGLKNKIIYIGFIWMTLILVNLLIDLPMQLQVILNLKWGILFLMGINYNYIYFYKSSWINHFQILCCVLLSLLMEDALFPYFLILFAIVFYILAFKGLSFIAVKPLIVFGEISYALYLIHQFFGYTIQYNLIQSGVTSFWILILFPLVISVLVSYVFTYYLERPIINKGNMIYKKYFNS